MTDNEPLIYLIGNYEKPEKSTGADQNRSPIELDQDILPPAPSSTQAYTLKDTEQHKDDATAYSGTFLSSALNLVAFIEQAEKKRKYFYDHGNAAKEALKYKLQTLFRDFNEASKYAGHAITHNTTSNRVRQSLASASRSAQMNMKRNVDRLRPPPIALPKKCYAAFVSAGALGLTTVFVLQSTNSNAPQEPDTIQPLYEEQDLVAINTLADEANDSFMLAPETGALATVPKNRPTPGPSTPEPLQHLSRSRNDTAIISIPLADDFRISSRYGMRFHPVKHRKVMHDGIDIAAPKGTPIEAPAAGTVRFSGRKGGYGKTVILDHGNGIKTLYAHLSHIHVNKGDYVKKDEVFAKVGATGRATGAHLHFEIHSNGKHVNPAQYVAEQQEKREIQMATGMIPAPAQKRMLR